MIILMGMSGSGKTAIAKELNRRGYERVITYTTRPIRENEKDGVDYHYISDKEFTAMVKNKEFAEWKEYNASFGKCKYGSTVESYKNKNKAVIILTPSGVEDVLDAGIEAIIVYVKCDIKTLINRLQSRGDDTQEINRRLAADKKDFANADNLADIMFDNSEADDIKNVCDRLEIELNKLNGGN